MNSTTPCARAIFPLFIIAASLSFVATAWTQTAQEYPPGPDSKPQAGVPKGEVIKLSFDHSKIFPGTYRDYWVYVPAQYKPDQPACVYVNQDGLKYDAPTVFDNLIFKKEMPVTIGVFVMHGRVRAADANSALDRFNRSYEYDGLGDNYVRFLLEELLPDVETKKTSDGRAIRLSSSGNDRAIGGESSGAICAFTAAWERPDAFSRVFSTIGTYVGLRGGERYPTLIRKYEPKPIRVFLQDGSNDLNIYGGDWWMANQTMERALTFAGYQVQHVWGNEAHNGKHATAIFPDAMRWLWKDWPQPVRTGETKNATLHDILVPGEGWQLAAEGSPLTGDPAADSKGEVFYVDASGGKKIGLDGKLTSFLYDGKKPKGLAFGADRNLYSVGEGDGRVVARHIQPKPVLIEDGVVGRGIVVASCGNIYVTSPPAAPGGGTSKIWLIGQHGGKRLTDTGIQDASGLTLSPDQTLLYVADRASHWIYSFQIQHDGSLQFGQRYYWLHSPDGEDESGAEGMCVDRDGRLYIATRLGVQVCDQAGRVNCIIPVPSGRVSALCFGGESFDTLFATCGDKVYKRKMKVTGANAWAPPSKPAAPRL
jgi:gluconolactonase